MTGSEAEIKKIFWFEPRTPSKCPPRYCDTIELKDVKLKYSDTLVVTFSESYETTVSLSSLSELDVRFF